MPSKTKAQLADELATIKETLRQVRADRDALKATARAGVDLARECVRCAQLGHRNDGCACHRCSGARRVLRLHAEER
jgi:hypothetical protein